MHPQSLGSTPTGTHTLVPAANLLLCASKSFTSVAHPSLWARESTLNLDSGQIVIREIVITAENLYCGCLWYDLCNILNFTCMCSNCVCFDRHDLAELLIRLKQYEKAEKLLKLFLDQEQKGWFFVEYKFLVLSYVLHSLLFPTSCLSMS